MKVILHANVRVCGVLRLTAYFAVTSRGPIPSMVSLRDLTAVMKFSHSHGVYSAWYREHC